MLDPRLVEDYNKLIEKYKEIMILDSVDAIIRWDMETKMPPGAFSLRSQQLALLSKIEHKMATDPETGILLGRIEKHPSDRFFEPKVTQETITKVFDELKGGILPIIMKYAALSEKIDTSILKRRVPVKAQEEISRSLAQLIGYDIKSNKARGRIDETEHPFTIGYYDGVRVTTHYYEENFAYSLYSVLHEGGHALYDLNLKKEWMYHPIGAACSHGFHESQSCFMENVIGRSYEFWEYCLPELKRITGSALVDLNVDEIVSAFNVVKPSKIRIEADEATYALHIIIRFELERDLFAGKLTVGELSVMWNQKYEDYLGVEIENDSEGVLQDVHWSHGYFGYFPSYALGNLYGGQILEWRRRCLIGASIFRRGASKRLGGWLVKNVHAYGNLYDPLDLLERITGESVTSKHFIEYLESKYSKIYG